MASNYVSNSLVADHYNSKAATDLDTRSKSPIFYLRNFNNWIKSVLINEHIRQIRSSSQKVSVLDLGAGKGGDILKWKKANVSHVTFLDIAEKSLDECRNRYHNPIRCNFDAEFIHLDATRKLIRDKNPGECLKHDMVSSQFVIHYSFESYSQANTFLQNVSDCLRAGGFFIGTTTDANEVVSRLKKSETDSFGNDIYNIKFHVDKRTALKDWFGVKFDFRLDNVVECPEFLISFDALVKLAKKHHLDLVFNQKFSDFFDKYSEVPEYRKLISVMKALEIFYSKSLNKSNEITEEVYEKEYKRIKRLTEKDEFKEIDDGQAYATISNSEWEAIQLYQCFAFVKTGPHLVETKPGSPVATPERNVETPERERVTLSPSGQKRKLDQNSDPEDTKTGSPAAATSERERVTLSPSGKKRRRDQNSESEDTKTDSPAAETSERERCALSPSGQKRKREQNSDSDESENKKKA